MGGCYHGGPMIAEGSSSVNPKYGPFLAATATACAVAGS